ncbi:unnamed protein product [Sphenostylis stenocarpa]|uniref:Uncharacterized protein n=1 Tax=Sphenostylis stenocarpa TaxID=92480 RepID=A0AA86S9U6_9FABA|nr:unnamed protein product [Sphenostylis stenocarpa]
MSAPHNSSIFDATVSSNPPNQIMHSMKRQLPFSSMKSPFSIIVEYHRFSPDHCRNLDTKVLKLCPGDSNLLGL